jgi:hypothetical protein
MRMIVRFLMLAVLVTALESPARSFGLNINIRLSRAVVLNPLGTNGARFLTRADYAITRVDKQMVQAFETAWRRSANGTNGLEGVILILRTLDGSHTGKDMGTTNERKQFTFKWDPATIAIVHTHPNSSDPKPQGEDLLVADKYQVPIFTITNRGMYVYDPGTKKIHKVVNNLDWLDASKFKNAVFSNQ